MADENYNIIVTDKVAPSIAQKLTAIDAAASSADNAIAQLRQDLARLDATSLNILASASQNAVNAVAAQTRAQAQLVNANARLTTATNAQTQAQARANAVNQQAAVAQARVGLVNQQTATAAQQTAAATARAAQAQISLQNSITGAGRAAGAAASGFHSSGTAIRELITIPREIIEGRGLGRVAGSISVLAQSQGLLTAATLPYIAAGIAVIGVLAEGVIAYENYENSVSKLQVSTYGLGKATGETSTQLGELATTSASAANISINAAVNMQSAFIRLGVTAPASIATLTREVRDYGAVVSEKLPQAQQELAQAVANPIAGIDTLRAKIGGFGLGVTELITKQQNEGDILGAQATLLGEVARQTQGAYDKTNAFGRSLDNLGTKASNFLREQGRQLAEFFSGQSDSDIVGNNQTRAQANAQAEQKARQQAQVDALKARRDREGIEARTIDLSTTQGGKRDQVTTLTQQRISLKKDLDDGAISAKQYAVDLGDVNAQIDKLNKQPKPPIDRELSVYDEAIRKYKDQASLQGLVGNDLENAQAFNQISEQAAKTRDPKTGKLTGGLSTDQASNLRAVIAEATRQKDIQQQLNTVYQEAIKPLDDYANRLAAIAQLQERGTLNVDQADSATLAANIRERTRSQFGYDQQNDPDAQRAGLRSQIDLQGELTEKRAIDLQVNNEIKVKQSQGLAYTRDQIDALAKRLTFEQAITKETEARDTIEKTSAAYQQQQLDIQRQALLDLSTRPGRGGLTQRQIDDTDQTYQLRQIDINTGANAGTASSAYNKTNDAIQQQLTDETRTYVELRKESLISAQEEAVALRNISLQQINANLAAGKGNAGSAIGGGLLESIQDFTGPLQSLEQASKQAFQTIQDDGSKALTAIVMHTESAGQAFKDLGKTLETNALQSVFKFGIQQTLSTVADKLGLSGSPAAGLIGQASGAKLGTANNPIYAKIVGGMGQQGGAGGLSGIGGLFGGNSSDGGGTLFSDLGIGSSGGFQGGSSAFGADAGAIAAPFASGGLVRGLGGPRDDANLAAVSHGEFIVNAAATAQHLPTLHAINSGSVSHFANGGYVGSPTTPYIQSAPVGGTSTNHNWDFSGASFGSGYNKEQAQKDFNDAYDAREAKTLGKARTQSVNDTYSMVNRQRVKG